MEIFDWQRRTKIFWHEVRTEVELLKKFHGDDAARIAAEKAARPTNRTFRRKVLEEAARQLSGKPPEPQKRFIGNLLGFFRKLLDRR